MAIPGSTGKTRKVKRPKYGALAKQVKLIKPPTAKLMKEAKKYSPAGKPGYAKMARAEVPTKAAMKVIRKKTVRAIDKGIIAKKSTKALGITRNEGGPKVRKALSTLGYARAEKVVEKTRARKAKPIARGKKR